MIALIKRYTVTAACACLVLLGLWLYLRHRYGHAASRSQSPMPVAVLPKYDKEQIIIDPIKHHLIIVTPTSHQVLSLPDHPSTIDIRKDGTVKVTSSQFGFEHRLFVGAYGSDRLRVAVGLDAAYFKRLDLGFGVAQALSSSTPVVFGQVSYSVWSNCRVGLAYGTNRFIGGTLTVRL